MKKMALMLVGILLASGLRSEANDRGQGWAVFFVRGLNSQAAVPPPIIQEFQLEFPSIPVVTARIGDGSPAATRKGLYQQLDDIGQDAMTNAVLNGKRVIVVGGSQGGLLARAFIERYGDKVPFTVDSFMSLAGQHCGQFGLPDGWESYIDEILGHSDIQLLNQFAQMFGIKLSKVEELADMTVEEVISLQLEQEIADRGIIDTLRAFIASAIKKLVKKDFPLIRFVFYTPLAQHLISVAGYWKDPMHRLDYLAFNQFLPVFNNEREHADAARYKTNMAKLRYVIFFWAGNDSMIKPSCSAAFRFFKWGSRTELQQVFTETIQYQQNLLGLRDLYDQGKFFFESPAGMGHDCGGPAIPIAMNYFNKIIA